MKNNFKLWSELHPECIGEIKKCIANMNKQIKITLLGQTKDTILYIEARENKEQELSYIQNILNIIVYKFKEKKIKPLYFIIIDENDDQHIYQFKYFKIEDLIKYFTLI